MTRHPKSISDLPDDKLPRPVWTELITQENKPPRIMIRMHPQAEEIMAEARKRGLKLRDGKFSKRLEAE